MPEPSVTLSSAAESCLLALGQTEPAYTEPIPLRGQLQLLGVKVKGAMLRADFVLQVQGLLDRAADSWQQAFKQPSPLTPGIPKELRSPLAKDRPPLVICRVLMSEGAMYARAPTTCVWHQQHHTTSPGMRASGASPGRWATMQSFAASTPPMGSDAMAWRRTWTRWMRPVIEPPLELPAADPAALEAPPPMAAAAAPTAAAAPITTAAAA